MSLLRDGHEFGNHGLVDKSLLVVVFVCFFFSRDFHCECVCFFFAGSHHIADVSCRSQSKTLLRRVKTFVQSGKRSGYIWRE